MSKNLNLFENNFQNTPISQKYALALVNITGLGVNFQLPDSGRDEYKTPNRSGNPCPLRPAGAD